MNKIIITCCTVALVLLAACQTKHEGYTLEGHLTGAENVSGTCKLQHQNLNGEFITLDSTTLSGGTFRMQGAVDEPQRCQLLIDLRKDPVNETPEGKMFIIPLYLENAVISVEGDIATLPDAYYNPNKKIVLPTIKGSESQNLYDQLKTQLKPIDDSISVCYKRYWYDYAEPMSKDTLHRQDFTAVGVKLAKAEMQYQHQRLEVLKAFIQNHPSSVVAMDQLTQLLMGFTVDYSRAQMNEMRSWVAESWAGKKRLAQLDSLIKVTAPLAIGEKYIDVDVETPEGKTVKLSSLIPKNKYVMLEFWASWCGPCRGEIPHLVRVHEKYPDFTIISISIDEKVADWTKAMKEEKMSWTQVRALGGFTGPVAQAYHILGIPNCIVLDPEGRFYRSNTRGANLDLLLHEIYNR